MKSKNYIILSLIAIFILSSCGSISLTQRRYSRGINIDWLAYGKTEKPEEKKANVAKKKTNPSAADNNTSTVAGAPASAPAENATIIAEDNSTTVPAIVKNTAPAAAKTGKVKKGSPLSIAKNVKQQIKENSHLKAANKTDATQQTNDSDVSLILLVILALLLPPLAVYLYFGELNAHFWINLILWLITGGLYFSGGAFFFLSFAVIHALLVVFGVFG